MRSTTRSLINALRVLDSEIQSEDGVANAVIAESAQRLEEQRERIKRLEEAGDALLNAENDDEEYKAILQWNKYKKNKR